MVGQRDCTSGPFTAFQRLAVLHPRGQFPKKLSLIFDDFLSFSQQRCRVAPGFSLAGLEEEPCPSLQLHSRLYGVHRPRGGCRVLSSSGGFWKDLTPWFCHFFPFHLPKPSVFFACLHSDCGWPSPDPLPSDPGLLLLFPSLLPSHCSIPHTGSTLCPHCSCWSRMNLQHLPQQEEPSKNKPLRSASQTHMQAGPKPLSLGEATLPVQATPCSSQEH